MSGGGSGFRRHGADFSAERRATIARYLRSEVVGKKHLSSEALEMLAVSLFICDDSGTFTKDALSAAMRDESLLAAARTALKGAGL